MKEKEVALEENQIKVMAMRRELEESPVSRLSVSRRNDGRQSLLRRVLK